MKKIVKPFLLFLFILWAIVYLVQYSIDYCYNKKVNQKFTKIFKHQSDPGIMVFGSSVAIEDIDPRIIKNGTGYDTYNMGWHGLFFVQYNALIKEYLSYEKNCKAIVLGCDIDNLGKNDLITRPDLFLAYLNNDYVYESLHEIEPQKIFRAKYLPGYKLTLLNQSFYRSMVFTQPGTDTLSGFSPADASWEETDSTKAYTPRYDDRVFAELKSTTAEIAKKGIKVILVLTPIYKEGNALIQNTGLIKSKYKSLVNKNIYFLDYTNDSICTSKAYFHNYSHLNRDGATRFSNTLTKDLLTILHE